jgi:hypothetical protein
VIRVALPHHLRNLARVGPEVTVEVDGLTTIGSILDAVEASYPMLKGTVRDHVTKKRRPFIRYFACGQDFSFAPVDSPLPQAVSAGEEPFMVVGAIAGG